jgi:selenide,water dikinase
MNIVCFPVDRYPVEILRETLAGGLEKIQESGAALLGGHSVDDLEFKYGLSVTGIVHPLKIFKNMGLRCKDRLILTKPVGTGILSTALKGKVGTDEDYKNLVRVCSLLNKKAAGIIGEHNPSACTDITGFGLAGHALEMAAASLVEISVDTSAIPVIRNVVDYASMGLIPAGTYRIKDFCGQKIRFAKGTGVVMEDIVFDPQTSGGLLAGMSPKDAGICVRKMNDAGIKAQIIGEVVNTHSSGMVSFF